MTSTIAQTDLEIEKIKKDLFKMAMRGQWEDVVNIYSENKKLHKAKLTSSGDTALHMAVSDGKEEEVRKLVGCIPAQPDRKDVLTIKNEQGSTPLHIAASMGNVAMCACIAEVDPSLVGARNDDNETPFFLAALSGKKDAFLRLHQICGTENGYEYSRRKDGDTILHCAIAGDYFDLAFRIIHLYKKLVNSFNEKGWTPLHLLASKPSAFRSGSHLGGWYKMIYYCIFVDELELDNQNFQETIKSSDHPSTGPENNLVDQKKQDYPENYKTCLDFLQFFWEVEKKNGVIRKDAQNHEKSDVKSKAATDVENPKAEAGSNATNGVLGNQLFPANYGTCFEFVKFASKAMLVIFGLGSTGIRKIQEKKQKHTWAVQIMNELLRYTSSYEYDATAGANPVAATISPTVATETETVPYDAIKFAGESSSEDQKPTALSNTGTSKTNQEDKNKETGDNDNTKQAKEKHSEKVLNATKIGITEIVEKIVELFPVALHDLLATKEKLAEKVKVKRETPVLIAAKNGITEIVEKILELFPVAIHDMNEQKKNIVLLAVENRQPHVYQLLLQKNIMKESVFRRVDDEGNSALHLAAKLGEHKPWLIPGAALQMQWEIKWHEFVKESMPFHFFQRYNNKGETSREIFTETHKDLVKDGSEWLTSTSESCSVVAALIATVAFASATTVPGGVKQDVGTPTLENQPAFDAFAISSLVALCFSVTALVMFLSILTSRYQEKDFGSDLPKKLLLGLTSLFVSIASMLIAFCAGHFFVLKDKLKYAAFPVYAVTCLPITFFAVAQFPLYFDLIWATFLKVPQRSYKVIPL
ncbi:uncharacterized protein LOC126709518 isoform X1 [Quercus robur]|uniref:uncharacterized protein LOC126709518 isoform X1 n=1 Tax=Quercus robur TaxID=38942 RepID=UPI0021631715|nr:uncharacterized protein LOC126709518 isoform X1 [Quercus robur]